LLNKHREALLVSREDVELAVAEVADVRGGQLAIATITSISVCWLPQLIQRFRAQHPGVDLRLIEHSSDGVAELVEGHQAGLGFLQLPVTSAALQHRTLLREPFLLIVPRRHELADCKAVRLRDLANAALIFYKGRARDTVLTACRSAGFEPRIACETGELETVRALVAAGLGLAIIPQLGALNLPEELVGVPLREPRIEREIGVVWSKAGPLAAAAQAFLGLMQEHPVKLGQAGSAARRNRATRRARNAST
jgi:DNA-binding transcriptional LysR family regulator